MRQADRQRRHVSRSAAVQRAVPEPAIESATAPEPSPIASQAAGHHYGDYAVAPPRSGGTPLVAVQRDGSSALPPTPNLQLTAPSLLQPAPAGPRLTPQYTLRLDPALQQQAYERVIAQLEGDRLRAAINSVRLGTPPGAGSGAATPATAPPAALSPTPSVSPQPSPPGNDPLDPAAAPKPASTSDLMDAMLATPEAARLVNTVKANVASDWNKLSTGEKGAVITTVASIGLGSLGGALASPASRQWALGALSGKVIPVPGVSWLSVEVNAQDHGFMFGAHVDVGRMLPPSLGFGASPSSPSPMSEPPVQRSAADHGLSGDTDFASRIREASDGGSALDARSAQVLSGAIGPEVGRTRLHYDQRANGLARDLHARAFTSGADIFFAAGTYAPETPEGRRLLAHEATHVQQQASGPVSGTPARGGITLSDPADPHERAAERAAGQIAAGWDAPVDASRERKR
jgi:hypothetical protein